MKPFRTSLTARLVSLSIAVALAGAGLSLALGLRPSLVVPLTFIAAITLSIFGLVVGVLEYPGAVLLLAILLPCALWPYAMCAEYLREVWPAGGWALLALAALPLGLTVVAPKTIPVAREASNPAAGSA